MRLFTHPKLRITLENINGTTYIKEVWRGILNSTVFRNLIMQSVEIYQDEVKKQKITENQSFLLFADVTELELIKKEDIEWLSKEVNQMYREIGFTHQAVIQPLSTFASETVAPYEDESEDQAFVTKIFTDEKQALQWYLNITKSH